MTTSGQFCTQTLRGSSVTTCVLAASPTIPFAALRCWWRLFMQNSPLSGDLRLPLFYSLIVLLLYPQHCLNKRFTVNGLSHLLACC